MREDILELFVKNIDLFINNSFLCLVFIGFSSFIFGIIRVIFKI